MRFPPNVIASVIAMGIASVIVIGGDVVSVIVIDIASGIGRVIGIVSDIVAVIVTSVGIVIGVDVVIAIVY